MVSSAERWRWNKEEKAKKDGSKDVAQIAENNNSKQIVRLTELANICMILETWIFMRKLTKMLRKK